MSQPNEAPQTASAVYEVLEPVPAETSGQAAVDAIVGVISSTGGIGKMYHVPIRQRDGEGTLWNWNIRGKRSARKLHGKIEHELATMNVDEFRQKREPKPKLGRPGNRKGKPGKQNA